MKKVALITGGGSGIKGSPGITWQKGARAHLASKTDGKTTLSITYAWHRNTHGIAMKMIENFIHSMREN